MKPWDSAAKIPSMKDDSWDFANLQASRYAYRQDDAAFESSVDEDSGSLHGRFLSSSAHETNEKLRLDRRFPILSSGSRASFIDNLMTRTGRRSIHGVHAATVSA